MATWYEEAVFYHMYPIGMTGAPRQNTEEGIVHRFEQLDKWLPHIAEIGCTAIYIGPLFESTTHGYDTRDYKVVDRRLGDNDDFIRFVKKAHELGIKVVVDGVFNHTGREFFAFQDIQRNREHSRYCSWYKGINFGWDNPYHDGFGYEAWRNCFELVNLNLWEPAVREYLLDVIDFWIDTFDIDGIRLDCADCLMVITAAISRMDRGCFTVLPIMSCTRGCIQATMITIILKLLIPFAENLMRMVEFIRE